MINMNVIYISNEDLLYKSFCRIISKLLISLQWCVVFTTQHDGLWYLLLSMMMCCIYYLA